MSLNYCITTNRQSACPYIRFQPPRLLLLHGFLQTCIKGDGASSSILATLHGVPKTVCAPCNYVLMFNCCDSGGHHDPFPAPTPIY